MQVIFKTSYDQDINLLSKTGEYIRVSLVIALMLVAPLFLDVYYLSELGLLLAYVIAGVGLMILTGFTGQVSFGHAAFLGIENGRRHPARCRHGAGRGGDLVPRLGSSGAGNGHQGHKGQYSP